MPHQHIPLHSAVAVGNFQAVGIARALEARRQEMLSKELEALFRLDEDGDGKVTLIEFITGALHQISGIDPEKEIHPWIKRFHELDADGNGYLDQNVSIVVDVITCLTLVLKRIWMSLHAAKALRTFPNRPWALEALWTMKETP